MEPFEKLLPEMRDVLVIMREASDNLYALRHSKPDKQYRLSWEMCTLQEIDQALETIDLLQGVIGYAQPNHKVPPRITAHKCMHDARYFWWFAYTMLRECRADGKYLEPSVPAMNVGLSEVRMMIANTRLCLEHSRKMVEDGRQDSV